MNVAGMTRVETTLSGRLLHFEAVPPQIEKADAAPSQAAADWTPFFSAAGLELKDLKPAAPKWFPLSWGDSRMAWEGTWPGRSDLPLRVEAASFRGKPIFFQLIAPWTQADRMPEQQRGSQNKIAQIFSLSLLFCVIAGAFFFARSNIKLERGDFQGARRLAVVLFCAVFLNWVLLGHHSLETSEFVQMLLAMSTGLFLAAFTWILYVALEPFIRRQWPHSLVSWTRMLKGQFRDPVVGRDALLGALLGSCVALVDHLQYPIERALGYAPGRPVGFTLYSLEGLRGSLASVIFQITNSLTSVLFFFLLFFVLRLVVKKDWIAAIALSLLYCIPSLGAANPWTDALFTAPFFILFMVVLWRFGLVCLAALFCTDQLIGTMPLVTPLNAWYAEGGMVAIVAILLLAFYGFQTSRAGNAAFSGKLLES
jgi:hypothetical protein